ncbi:uncharacterized protein LOC124938702 [Impatiens glandulifera]|uniref:uncharacterized protein LOC124938702 n=1 Tax=Impatiens glandulifera TaxID=253017 RepID=UPI001FB0A33A|nr:uncharacterized protein LOC124938702 [Impatiens glandulifera]
MIMELLSFMEDGGVLLKVGLFIIVQALVYMILSKSSFIFNSGNQLAKSFSFSRVRSINVRQMMAVLADMPAGGEYSSSASSSAGTSSKNLFRSSTYNKVDDADDNHHHAS